MPTLMTMNAAGLEKLTKRMSRLTKAQKQYINDVEAELDGYGRLLQQTMQQKAYKKTGTFGSGIAYQIRRRGDANMMLEVRWSPKGGQPKQLSDWMRFGTGIYGPRGKPITPKRAKFLRFTTGGRVVFAKSVRGMKPNDYVEKAWGATAGARQAMITRIGNVLANFATGSR